MSPLTPAQTQLFAELLGLAECRALTPRYARSVFLWAQGTWPPMTAEPCTPGEATATLAGAYDAEHPHRVRL